MTELWPSGKKNAEGGKDNMKFQASINGIKGTVQYRDEDVQKIFLPLLEKWKAMQERKGRRILVFLAAPPGTGKSTLLAFLRQLSCGEILPGAPSSEEQDRTPITTIGNTVSAAMA